MSIKLTDFNRLHSRQSQRGVALILVAIGLVVMLGIAGLALDASHALTNKTRLQNTTDAAALAAAKEYDQAADIVLANAAALSIFGINADGAGFLNDPTGSRRFVVVSIESLDHDYTKRIDINQLWAQIMHMYKNGEPWRLQANEKKAQGESLYNNKGAAAV